MGHGGARNRSGPQKDETSGRSERLGVVFTALPAEGYNGEPPDFPLPRFRVYSEYIVDGEKIREFDESASEIRWEREQDLWMWAWSTPQAYAWSVETWRWHAVAMWVRTAALCETSDALAADKNSLHRFADQIGLTPAGLKENGWKIASGESDEVPTPQSPTESQDDPRARFTVVDGGA